VVLNLNPESVTQVNSYKTNLQFDRNNTLFHELYAHVFQAIQGVGRALQHGNYGEESSQVDGGCAEEFQQQLKDRMDEEK
jgi:hypothetical protein